MGEEPEFLMPVSEMGTTWPSLKFMGFCYMAFVDTMILWGEGWDGTLVQSFAYPRIYSLLGKAPVLVCVKHFEPYLHSGFVLKLVHFLKKLGCLLPIHR